MNRQVPKELRDTVENYGRDLRSNLWICGQIILCHLLSYVHPGELIKPHLYNGNPKPL